MRIEDEEDGRENEAAPGADEGSERPDGETEEDEQDCGRGRKGHGLFLRPGPVHRWLRAAAISEQGGCAILAFRRAPRVERALLRSADQRHA